MVVNSLKVQESPFLVEPGGNLEGATVDQPMVRGERCHHLRGFSLKVCFSGCKYNPREGRFDAEGDHDA